MHVELREILFAGAPYALPYGQFMNGLCTKNSPRKDKGRGDRRRCPPSGGGTFQQSDRKEG
jgi:hypothetical protein